ncbi:PLP-dependent aminotransferase family protein [Pinirhizobacter sp.]|jgi:GntR family transcriptional regulator/MocR family aminotransferase|uniref:MocR-like pyridoxine biosynthesis transcription factor PdxR n=1 Tax=Pinirhizobacter sp. TaxID=2950432 RepID=UPI002F4213E0
MSTLRRLPFAISRQGEGSLQSRIHNDIRQAIQAGRLAPGARLPSTRSLASELGVARGTVDAVYARLTGEGYIVGRGSAGTIVSPTVVMRRSAPPVSPPSGSLITAAMPIRFHIGLPSLDLFPYTRWARLVSQHARKLSPIGPHHPNPAGLPALREAIVGYLAVARGFACHPAQVFITAGYQGALDLATRLVLREKDSVWFEDPGYSFARDALAAKPVRVVPVPVDGEGLRVDDGIALAPQARLAIVTPSHQSPLTVTMSQARRQLLLDWAEGAGSWVVEDDYDSEFHYAGFRPAALKSIDAADRVFFAGSFSKTLLPSLRLGFLVVPETFIAAAGEEATAMHRGEAAFMQQVVATFIAEGHFSRHLRRMRARYDARRRALATALTSAFGDTVEIRNQGGGLHLIAQFHGHGADIDIMARARASGLWVSALSAQSTVHPAGDALMLGFANIPEQEAAKHVAALKRAIASHP